LTEGPSEPPPGRFLRNLLYLVVGEGLSKIVTFAAIAYLARVVGPTGMGYVEFAMAVFLCASLVVDQGFGPYGARELARRPEGAVELLRQIVSARTVIALITTAGVTIAAVWLAPSPIVRDMLLLEALGLLALPLLFPWLFQGQNRMGAVAALQLVRQLVFAGVIFTLLRREQDVRMAAVADLLGICAAAAGGVWLARSSLIAAARAGPSLPLRLFRETLPIGISTLFWMMRMFGATALLGTVASAQDVGFFGAAMRLYVAIHTFVYLHFFNLLPSLSRAWHQDAKSFTTLVGHSLRLVAWVGVVGGTAWLLLAPTAVTLVYGAAFAPAAAPLRWLGAALVVTALSGHYRYGLIATGHQPTEMLTAGIGTLSAVVLVPLGYTLQGTSGAAMALFVCELLVWATAWGFSRSRLGLVGHSRLLIPPAVAALVGLSLFWLLPFSVIVRTAVLLASVVLVPILLDGESRAQLRDFARGFRVAHTPRS
jgi:O-antigen/teichoic acid export membrane protein